MNPLVYIVVLNWNGKKFIENCLSSILQSTYKNIRVLIVDNNSYDGSDGFIKKHFAKVLLVKNKRNLGWAGGNNVGIDLALKNRADAILLLNQDTKIDKRAISYLVQSLYADSKIGIIGPKIYTSQKEDSKH